MRIKSVAAGAPPVYECVHGHDHAFMTTANLCESAPKRDVRLRLELHGTDVVGLYECFRCGKKRLASAPADRLVTLNDNQVGFTIDAKTEEREIRSWQAEAREFQDEHTGCNAEGTS